MHRNEIDKADRTIVPNEHGLTHAQELFCQNVAENPTSTYTDCYIAAYDYTGKSHNANAYASKLMNNPAVMARIQAIRSAIVGKVGLTEAEILTFWADVMRDEDNSISQRMGAAAACANYLGMEKPKQTLVVNDEPVQIVFGD